MGVDNITESYQEASPNAVSKIQSCPRPNIISSRGGGGLLGQGAR